MQPNLFRFATSELSQDAFFCWLLSWAHPATAQHNPALHELGRAFLESMYAQASASLPARIESVQVERQRDRIDIACIVNRTEVVLIEDKVHTCEHSDQLRRYKDTVQGWGFEPNQILPTYIHTGYYQPGDEVRAAGYTVMNRASILRVLEAPVGRSAAAVSDVVRDFTTHLRGMEDALQNHLKLPTSAWPHKGCAWIGFFEELKGCLTDGDWCDVSNPQGGFLAFYWSKRGDDAVESYLELAQEQLRFKICVADPDARTEEWLKWSPRFVQAGEQLGLPVTRTHRRSGLHMTVAALDGDYRMVDADGRLDFEKTLGVIRQAERAFDAAVTAAA